MQCIVGLFAERSEHVMETTFFVPLWDFWRHYSVDKSTKAFFSKTFWLTKVVKVQMLLITLQMAPFRPSVPVSHDSVIVSQHAQYQDLKLKQLNGCGSGRRVGWLLIKERVKVSSGKTLNWHSTWNSDILVKTTYHYSHLCFHYVKMSSVKKARGVWACLKLKIYDKYKEAIMSLSLRWKF